MGKNRITYLYDQYLGRKFSSSELTEFKELLSNADQQQAFDQLIDNDWDGLQEGMLVEVTAESRERMLKAINEEARLNKIKLRYRVAVAAAAIFAITLGVWLFYTPRHPEASADLLAYTNDIPPGRNTATLTLANGKVIHLDTNKTSVVATDSVKNTTMLTASTPRGGTYQVVLPDGTKVWLNADSKITFPSQFSRSKREVSIAGELYFEVAEDKTHPFIVKSEGQQIEVLGTHFNVNAYADEKSIKTTLLEGSVKVSPSPIPSSSDPSMLRDDIMLKPGQQSLVGSDKRITIKNIIPEDAIAWKDGYFRFYEVDLQTFMNTIARWYDIEVDYEGGIHHYKGLAFGGSVSRSKNISEVLKILAQTGKVHYRIEGRKVTITI